MVAKWHASGGPTPREVPPQREAERTRFEPEPLPPFDQLDAEDMRWTNFALGKLVEHGVGFYEAVATVKHPNVVKPGKFEGRQLCFRGDVRVVFDPVHRVIVSVSSTNHPEPRTPLVPEEAETAMPTVSEALNKEVRAKLAIFQEPQEPESTPMVRTKAVAVSAGTLLDRWIEAPHDPMAILDLRDLYEENAEGLMAHYGTNEQSIMSNLTAGASQRVKNKKLVRMPGRVGKLRHYPETQRWAAKEVPKPDPLPDPEPVAAQPAEPKEPTLPAQADSPSEETITTEPDPVVIPSQVLARQDGTPREQVGAVMDDLKRMLRNKRIKFKYSESGEEIAITIPLAEDE